MRLLSTIASRIQIFHGALTGLLICLLLVLAHREQRAQHLAAIDTFLSLQVRYLLPKYLPPPGMGQNAPRARSVVLESAERERTRRGAYFMVFDGVRLVEASPGAPATAPPQREADDQIDAIRWRDGRREAIHFSPSGRVLLAGLPRESYVAELDSMQWHWILIGILTWVANLAIGGWIVRLGLRPIERITREARAVIGASRTQRITAPTPATELTGLVSALNETFDRLDNVLDRQKQFTADAAHELGTPVSIIISQTQLALSRPRESAEYIAALESCSRAGHRMRVLTRDLLDLAEFDAGIPAARLVACDLAEIAREAIQEATDAEHSPKIVEILDPAPGHFHPVAMTQVFSNLIRNAIKHNAPEVAITITTGTEPGGVFGEVRDNGTGIPESDLPKIFDRFQRGEKPRSSNTGGSGLGLAICKAIIEAHDGSIEAGNRPGVGLWVRFHIPRQNESATRG